MTELQGTRQGGDTRQGQSRPLAPGGGAATPGGRTPAAPHPCPKGDGCALNSGARHCKHCGRNWPPDETWERT